jgi:hypothetical protein
MDNKVTKRLSNDKRYERPEKTYQDNLSNQDIKDKLKDYKKVIDIKTVSIGTHIRYFTIDSKTKQKYFRLGGTLNKIDPEGRFIILGNGTVSWSVQIPTSIFYQKLTENEYKEELKKELKKEIMTEEQSIYEDTDSLKKEIKVLNKKLDKFKDLENDYKKLLKINENLTNQINKIEEEIKKKKNKK